MTTTVDTVNKSVYPKQYKRVFACLIVAIAALWALMGSWLTANEITEAGTEFNNYFYSFGIASAGVFIYFRSDSRRTKWSGAATLMGMIALLLIVFDSCVYSNDTFIFWKIRAVKQAVWQQMISDLRLLDDKWRSSGPAFIPRDQAPRSFDVLALPRDCSGVHMGIGGHPVIVCGVKSRRWGLVIGSNSIPSFGNGALIKRIQVGDDAWFFAGPGG